MCDRILVMCEGRVACDLQREDGDEGDHHELRDGQRLASARAKISASRHDRRLRPTSRAREYRSSSTPRSDKNDEEATVIAAQGCGCNPGRRRRRGPGQDGRRVPTGTRENALLHFIKANATLIALVVLVAVLSVADDTFLTPRNLSNLARQVTIIGIVAVGMTMVILIGGIDLSVGSVVGPVRHRRHPADADGAQCLARHHRHAGARRRADRPLERVLDHLLQDPAVHHHARHADHRPRLGARPVRRHLGARHRPDLPQPRRRLHPAHRDRRHPGGGAGSVPLQPGQQHPTGQEVRRRGRLAAR